MSDTESKMLSCLGVIALLIITIALQGWVASVLWAWFVVPLFNAPTLSIAYAIGLSVSARVLVGWSTGKNDDEFAEAAAKAIGYPLIVLAYGWIIHLFT